MVKPLVLVVVLCAPLPAVAQSSKVYTNADLSSRPVTFTRAVTPDEWAGIVSRQFIPPTAVPVVSINRFEVRAPDAASGIYVNHRRSTCLVRSVPRLAA